MAWLFMGAHLLASGGAHAETTAAARPADAASIARLPPRPLPAGAVKLAAPTASAATPTASVRPSIPAAKPGVPARPVSTSVPVANGMVRVPIAVEGSGATAAPSALRITSGAGSIIPGKNGEPVLETASEGRVVLSSDPGKASAALDELHENEKTPLPWIVIETRKDSGGASVRTSRPFLTVAKAITWDAATKRHLATFFFGLDAESGDPGPLDSPIDARFTVTCDDVAPAEAQVKAVGPAGYQTITVGCSAAIKNERKTQELEVFVDRGNLSYPFSLPHRAGAPTLAVDQSRVYGLGFGATELTVRSVEEDGSPLDADADLLAQLVFSGGGLNASPVTIKRGTQMTTLTLHPRGVGAIAVTAVLRELQSPPLPITLTWPLVPLIAILAGGLIGGLIRAKKENRKKLGPVIAQSVLIGLLMTALALILPSIVELPTWALQTELGLFVVSALAGYVGIPLLDRVSSLVFPATGKERA
jgi:hypothetical protein